MGMRLRSALALVLTAFASPALAHSDEGTGGFIAGLAHPIFGLDHVVAMLAVGLWGAFLGPPAIWLLPIVFPLVMAAGGVLGIIGLPLPAVETGIAASAGILRPVGALAARPPVWAAPPLGGGVAGFSCYAPGRGIARR